MAKEEEPGGLVNIGRYSKHDHQLFDQIVNLLRNQINKLRSSIRERDLDSDNSPPEEIASFQQEIKKCRKHLKTLNELNETEPILPYGKRVNMGEVATDHKIRSHHAEQIADFKNQIDDLENELNVNSIAEEIPPWQDSQSRETSPSPNVATKSQHHESGRSLDMKEPCELETENKNNASETLVSRPSIERQFAKVKLSSTRNRPWSQLTRTRRPKLVWVMVALYVCVLIALIITLIVFGVRIKALEDWKRNNFNQSNQ